MRAPLGRRFEQLEPWNVWNLWNTRRQEHAQAEALLGLEEPMQIAASITRKLEEKFSLMAAVCNVPDRARQKVAVCSRHRLRSLRGSLFALQKPSLSSERMPFIRSFTCVALDFVLVRSGARSRQVLMCPVPPHSACCRILAPKKA
jgi:hypothetical protein